MGASRSATSSLRRLARLLALGGLAVAAVLALAVLLVLLPIRVPIGFLMPRVEQVAGAAIGLPVRIEGPVTLTLGLRPRLDARNVRVERGGVEGPGAGEPVVELGRASLQLALAPLLGQRVAVREAVLDGLVVRVDRELLTPSDTGDGPEAAAGSQTGAEEATGSGVPAALSEWALDIDRLALRDLRVVWTDDDGSPVTVRLDHFDGKLDWRRGIELAGNGGYEDHDIRVRFEAGSIEGLLRGDSAWPLSVAVDGALGPWRLAAGISRLHGTLRLEDLAAQFGSARISGAVSLDPRGVRPRVEGTLRVTGLGVGAGSPSGAQPREPADRTQGVAGGVAAGGGGHASPDEAEGGLRGRKETRAEDARSPAAVLVDILDRFETDLTLEIDAISGPGPEVRDVTLRLDVSDGRLRFPISLSVAAIPLSGTLAIGRDGEMPSFVFELSAEDFRVEQLGAWAAPDLSLRGSVGRVHVELEARGEWLEELVASTTLSIGARDADLAYGVGEDRRVTFERLGLEVAGGGTLRVVGEGTVLGETVSIEARGPTFTAMLAPDGEERDEPWPVALRATGPGLELSVEGSWAGPSAALDSELELVLAGDSPATLRSWLGEIPFPDASYAFDARVVTDETGMTFTIERAQLGRSSLQARFRLDERESGPHFDAAITVDYIDLESLLALGAPSPEGLEGDQDADQPEAGGGLSLDIPIVPDGIRFVDAELELTVGEIGGTNLGLKNLELRSTITESSVEPSPFSFRLHDTRFEGSVSADLMTSPPSARFELGTRDIDIGGLLADLGVVAGVHARAADMKVVVNGRGRSLGEIVDGSDLTATIKEARWTLGDPGSETALPFRLSEATLIVPQGDEPMRAWAEGKLRAIPVKLELETEPLSTRVAPEDPISVVVRLEAARTRVELEASVTPPVRRETVRARLAIDASSTAALGDAFGYELDELGAFKLEAAMEGNAEGFALSSFHASVGRSRLAGHGRLVLTGPRPRLDLELESERIQIEDFLVDRPERGENEQGKEPELSEAPGTEEQPWITGDTVAPLGPDGLQRYDGSLKVVVAEVRSGDDALGMGVVHVTLDDGTLALQRLDVAVPGGSLGGNASLRWEGDRALVMGQLAIENFDMGVAARRADPDTTFGGTLDLYVRFESDAPELSSLLAHGNGEIDFAMAPENLEADVLDLWVVNLVAAVLPRLDNQPTSKINCVVAAFDLEDGIMEERALLIDTTTMVISGKTAVDFRDRTISARLGPQPKKPAMFSLQTRVGVSGSFEDPSIGVAPSDALGTFVGFWASVVIVPIERLVSGTLPADGRATCAAAWKKARARHGNGDAAAPADGTGGVDVAR